MFPQAFTYFGRGNRALRLFAAFAVLLTTIGVPILARGGSIASAGPGENFSLTKTDDKGGEALIGEHVTYTLTARGTHSSTAYLYNLSFRDVLPAGVSFVSGSPSPTAVLANVPAAGQTTLVWENVTDLPAGSFSSVSYTVDTNPDFGGGSSGSSTAPVGSTVTNSAQAVASLDAFLIPDWSPATGLFTGDFDGTASASHNVSIAPFRVKKSGPGELLRGVHGAGFGGRGGTSGDTYTIEVQNNPDYATNTVSLLDTLSPMLEFLGCENYYSASDDNSTDVPFRSSTVADEEWQDSGPMATGASASTCLTPDSVTTVGTGTGNLANTEVRWTLGNLAPNQTIIVTYRAGIPMRANTTDWTTTGGAPAPATRNQGRNLDNNAGPATNELDMTPGADPELLADGAPNVPNTAAATGTYTPSSGVYTKQKTHDTEAEDIIIGKSMAGSLSHGTIVNSALTISTSEYRDFTNLTVRDLMPSALCFLGTYGSDVSGSDWATNDCAGAGTSPSIVGGAASPATRVRELPTGGPYGTGRFEVLWSYTSIPALTSLKSDSTVSISYQSRVRTAYRGNLQRLAGEPVLAGDEVTNAAEVHGPDWVVTEHTNSQNADPEPGGGNDGDTTGATLTNVLPSINKRISAKAGPLADGSGVTAATCANHAAITWQEGPASGFGPGDIVCFELGATFNALYDYENTEIHDLLPPGYTYITGSAARIGAIDNLPGATVSLESAQLVKWDLGTVTNAGHTFRWVIAARLGVPDTAVAKDINANLQKMIHNQNGGIVFQYRDEVPAEWTEPQVRLAKAVEAVDAANSALDVSGRGPDADGSLAGPSASVPVQSLADVTYRIDVWNTGNKVALDTEVWDDLPLGFTCAMVSTISHGGACSGDVIRWSGLPSIAVDTTMATAPLKLTYHVQMPLTIAAGETFVNRAGVRKYQAEINTVGAAENSRYDYYPRNNIDSTVTPNTDAADDIATVGAPQPGLVKGQASGIAETGNSSNGTPATAFDQATIGEIVAYRFTLTIPDGTSAYKGVLTDALPAGLTYFAGSAYYGGSNQTLAPSVVSTAVDADGKRLDGGTLSTPAVGSNGTITYTLLTPYRNASDSGDDTVVVTVYARVDGGNRGDTRVNSVRFDWENSTGSNYALVSPQVTLGIVEPNPSIAKVHTAPSGTVVAPGQTVTYQVTFTNSGPDTSPLHNAELEDTVPPGITPLKQGGGLVAVSGDLVVATPTTPAGPAFTGTWNETFRTITWTATDWSALSAINPGASRVFSYQAEVDDPATASGTLTNTVAFTGRNLIATDPNLAAGRTYTGSDPDTLDLPAASIIKDVEPLPDDLTDRSTFAVGETVDYDIEVRIAANTIAYDLTVFDDFPSQLTFDSVGTPTLSATCERYPGGSPVAPGSIAHFTGVGGNAQRMAWFGGDIHADGGDCVITLPYTMHVNSTAVSGNALTNTSTLVWNRTDEISGTPSGSLPTGYTSPTSPSWDVGRPPSSQTINVIEPQVEIDKDVTTVTGAAIAPCDTTLGNNRTGTDDRDTDVGSTNGCDITSGAVQRYTVRVANTGTAPAHDLRTVDTVPAGLVVLASPGGAPVADGGTVTGAVGAAGTWNATNRTITWLVAGPVAPGTAIVFGYDAVTAASNSLTQGQDLTNTIGVMEYYGLDAATRASITNPDVPTYGLSLTRGHHLIDQTTVEVHFPQLAINKVSVSDATDARFDQPFTFSLTVNNTSTVAPAYNVDIVDTLPAGWTYAPNSAQVTTPYGGPTQINPAVSGQTLTWTDVVAGAGQPLTSSGTVTIVFAATPSRAILAPDAATGISNTGPTNPHVNQARVNAEDSSGSTQCCSGSAYTATDSESVYIRRADLSVTKAILDALPVSYGDLVTYAITVTNSGPSAATGVTLEDLLAPDLTFDSVAQIQVGTTYTSATGVWNVGSLPVGATYELRLRVRVDAEGTITNTAEVKTSNQWDPDSTPGNRVAGEDDQASVTIDAEFVSLGNRVWLDLDRDGVQDPGEPGIPNVPVAISWLDADSTLQVRIVNTDDDGNWSIAGLPVVHPITVTVDPGSTTAPAGTGGGGTALAGLTQTFELIDNPVLTATQAANGQTTGLNHEVTGIVLTATNRSYLDVDFGYVGVNSVGDRVWFDRDGGGEATLEAGDYGLPGVDLTLRWAGWDGVFGNGDDLTFTTTTDDTGTYLFPDLPDGRYRVDLDSASLPGTLLQTFDLNGVATPHTSGEFTLGLAGSEPEDRRDVDFAYTGEGSLGDTVWFDQDLDGVQDSAEVPLAGITVRATYVLPNDTVITLTTTTDSAGKYLFDHLPLDVEITVTVDDTTLPAGFTVQTHDLDGVATPHTAKATLTSAAPSRLDVDFGYAGTAALGDHVWFDVNNSATATPDAGEPPIVGATVTLRWTNPTGGADMVLTRTTDADGKYLFPNLPAGTYSVTVSNLPAGTAATYDADGGNDLTSTTDLESGETVLTQDFSVTGRGTLGDTVWHDVDGDGVVDDGEPRLEGVKVRVVWTDPANPSNTYTWDLTTDAEGKYLAINLPAGTYRVTVDPTTVPDGMAATFDRDGTADHTTQLTLGPAQTDLTVDFGYRLNADLSITKTHSAEFRIGEENAWVLTVRNAGPAGAIAPVTITDDLPTGVEFVRTNAAEWTCSLTDRRLSCTYTPGVFASGAASSLDVIVRPTTAAAPSVTNIATVTSPTPDRELINNRATDVTPIPLSRLVITKSVDGQLRSGGTATYTLTIRNDGPSPTSGTITVADELPDALSFVSASAPNGWVCTGDRKVSCTTDATLGVNETAVIRIETRVNAGAGSTVANTATVSGGNVVEGRPLPIEVSGVSEHTASAAVSGTNLAFTGASRSGQYLVIALWTVLAGAFLAFAAHRFRRRHA